RSKSAQRYSISPSTTPEIPNRSSSLNSTRSSGNRPSTEPNSFDSLLDPSAKIPQERRLMAVTKQEEALLEAMRQKRANMRGSNHEHGASQVSLSSIETVRARGRPKTSASLPSRKHLEKTVRENISSAEPSPGLSHLLMSS